MADVKWIKITTDIFDDEKILLIESMPSADSIIVIWFKLLCLAGKQNNSGVFMMNHRIAYTDEMLASIFRREINVVRMALKVFEQFGMIEIIDGVITIPNWGKHQNLDQLERKKEYQRNYMRDYREKQRLLSAGAAAEDPAPADQKSAADEANCKTNSNTHVSPLDKEEDKEVDKEEERDKKDALYAPIISRLNEKAGTAYKPTTKKTQALIRARIKEGYTLEDFFVVIDRKCAEWIGTKMEEYLRPETLFGTKFEGYLNTGSRKEGQHGSNQSNYRALGEKVGTYL